jgi:hypothetical protein
MVVPMASVQSTSAVTPSIGLRPTVSVSFSSATGSAGQLPVTVRLAR